MKWAMTLSSLANSATRSATKSGVRREVETSQRVPQGSGKIEQPLPFAAPVAEGPGIAADQQAGKTRMMIGSVARHRGRASERFGIDGRRLEHHHMARASGVAVIGGNHQAEI